MYIVLNAMIASVDDFYFNVNTVYMTFMMARP